MAALVLDVQAGGDAVGDHPGAKRARGGPDDLALEQQLDPVGPAEVEVLADDLLEELPAAQGPVEDLGAADLQLQDRQPVAEAGGRVGRRQGQRQLPGPAPKQGLDVGRAQTVAEPPAARPGRAQRRKPLSSAVKAIPPPRQLALGPLVAVEAQLQRVGGVAADLEEAGPPLRSMK